jgi:hypothetical protein
VTGTAVSRGRAADTVVAMVGDHRSRIGMPTATLGAGGPVVSRIGLGLAALGRPAYITSGREQDLPDRSVAGLRQARHQLARPAGPRAARRPGARNHGPFGRKIFNSERPVVLAVRT